VIQVIKSRKIERNGMGMKHIWETRVMHTGFWGGPEGRNHPEDPGVDGRIIFNGSTRGGMGPWTGLIWLRIGTDGGLFKCGNKRSGSIKCG
jgi:hypothetical protein